MHLPAGLIKHANTLRKKATARQLRYLFAILVLAPVPWLRRRYSAYSRHRYLRSGEVPHVFDQEIAAALPLTETEQGYLEQFRNKTEVFHGGNELGLRHRVTAYRLTDCEILPRSFSVVHHPSERIQLCPDWRLERNVVRPFRPRSISHESGLVISMRQGPHYFHFLLDRLVMLHRVLSEVPEVRSATVLLGEKIAPYQRAGYDIVKREYPELQLRTVRDDEKVVCDQLIMACRDGHHSVINVFADTEGLRHVGRSYREHYRVGDCKPQRLILLSRKQQKLRRLLNEDELFARLAPLGFELVVPENLPHDQQVALFASARVVIGGCGAALTNLVFCQPGGLLVELCPIGLHEPFWFALAMQVRLKHRFVGGQDIRLYDAFTVDIEQILAILQQEIGLSA